MNSVDGLESNFDFHTWDKILYPVYSAMT